MVLAFCAVTALPAAFLFCTSDQLVVSRSAYVLFNFLVFAATPAGLTGWQLLTPERSAGITVAILVSVVTLIGVGLGPVVVGWLNDHVFQDGNGLGKIPLCRDFVVRPGVFCAGPGRPRRLCRRPWKADSDEIDRDSRVAHFNGTGGPAIWRPSGQ